MSKGITEEEFEKILNLKIGESYLDPESNSYHGSGYRRYEPEYVEKVMKCIGNDTTASICQFCKEKSYYKYDLNQECIYWTSICIKCHIGFFAAVACTMIC